MKKLIVISLIVMISMLCIPSIYAKELNKKDYIAEFGKPANPAQLLNVRGVVHLDHVKAEAVFNYLSNLENDVYIYPGTLFSQRISGNGGAGTIYHETIYFAGTQANITATVLEYKSAKWFKFKSDGLLQNVSAYTITKAGKKGVKLELESFVQVPNGVTQADMNYYMSLVLQNIITAMNTTGRISIY